MDEADKKIQELVIEVRKIRSTKSNLSHDEIKSLLNGRGTDDELDMAIVLAEVQPVNWTLELVKMTGWMVLLLGLVLIFDILETIFGFNIIQGDWYLFVILLGLFLFYTQNVNYRKKYFDDLLKHDFAWEELTANQAKDYLHKIKGVPDDAQTRRVLKCQFDGRETYFGYFSWERGSGKSRRIYHRTFVMQLVRKSFDPILVQPHTAENWLFTGEDVQLESNEFNDKFVVKTGGNPKNAFYTLNPRVMEIILQEYEKYNFNFLQVNENMVVIGYDEREAGLGLSARFSLPVITFVEYNLIKQKILRKLDVAANVADGLLREVVDEAEVRSVAEQ